MKDWMDKELGLVEQYLREFTEDLSRREPLSGILAYVLGAPGKRLRPRMVLACGFLGNDFEARRDRLCRIGALIEMVHCASLIHDDIIDDSSLRRGKRTVQSKYGKDMAVYTGDYILGKVLYYLMEMGAADSGMILGRCVQDMCAGELNQHSHRFDCQVSKEQYLASINGKTAALFRAACSIGALEGGCGGEGQRKAGDMGENIGMFFQIRDDLMDFQAGEQWDGKPACQDFFQGIYTLPVVRALEYPLTEGRMRSLIRESRQGQTGEAVLRERLNRLIFEAGGVRYATSCMEKYKKNVFNLLKEMPEGRGRNEIERMVRSLASKTGG